MAKISDFKVLVKGYHDDSLVTTFESNLWAGQETFRRLLGPDSEINRYVIYYKDRTVEIKDPINWDHPVCCDKCREEAAERKKKKQLADVAQ